jgi:hypothetical protein
VPLKLKVLDAPQRALWVELGQTPSRFTLYGGTALALQLGHRKSVDFDFFSATPFDPDELERTVPYLAGASLRQKAPSTLTMIADRGGPVNISFFAPPKRLTVISPPYECKRPLLRLASLIDLAATKLNTVPARSAAKDYLDVHALIKKAGIDLVTQLAAVAAVFPGQAFNPHVILKSLCYFHDGDLATLPATVKRDLTAAVAGVDVDAVDALIARTAADPSYWNRL